MIRIFLIKLVRAGHGSLFLLRNPAWIQGHPKPRYPSSASQNHTAVSRGDFQRHKLTLQFIIGKVATEPVYREKQNCESPILQKSGYHTVQVIDRRCWGVFDISTLSQGAPQSFV